MSLDEAFNAIVRSDIADKEREKDIKTVSSDGYHWRSSQEILVAIGLGGGRVLGYEGSNVYLAITDEGMDCKPFWQETDDIFHKPPAHPGIYLWKGNIGIHFDDIEGFLDNISLKGDFSVATPEDIARLMGKHDELYPEEDDRS